MPLAPPADDFRQHAGADSRFSRRRHMPCLIRAAFGFFAAIFAFRRRRCRRQLFTPDAAARFHAFDIIFD